ncbi:hypothetical protein BGZ94_002122 [Podila epigama]|nr:hypothetical protein BGZ94_002122 [Podila epigama]
MTLRFLRDQYDPTIEDSYCKHIEVDGREYTLDITDTAGQEEYRGHWNDKFMRAGDGFICVYSIASMGSFQELVGFRNQIWRAKESEHVPMVLAANKCDLVEEREVDTEIGQEFAAMSNAYYIETSAKTGFNINEAMLELVRQIVRSRTEEGREGGYDEGHGKEDRKNKGYQKSPTPPGGYVDEQEDVGKEERGCCCTIM